MPGGVCPHHSGCSEVEIQWDIPVDALPDRHFGHYIYRRFHIIFRGCMHAACMVSH